MKASQTIIMGSTAVDITAIGNRRYKQAGGVVIYAGYTFRKHHIATRVITGIGSKQKKLIRLYATLGAMLQLQGTPVTTRIINRYLSNDTRRQHILDQAAPICVPATHWPPPATGHVHLGPLHPTDIDPGVLASLKNYPG